MPPKNVAVPNAVKLFHCKICDKGYARQTEYENHLRSYDHNHRQRLADMKQITAANDRDNNRKGKRGTNEMRKLPIDNQPGLGKGFKKVGIETGGAGAGFKKVGVIVEEAADGVNKPGVPTSVTPAPAGFKKVGVTASGSGSDPVAVTKTPSEAVDPAPTPVEPFSGSSNVDNGSSEAEIKALAIKLPAEIEAISGPQQDFHFHDDDGENSGGVTDEEDSEDSRGSEDGEDLGGPKDEENLGGVKDGENLAGTKDGESLAISEDYSDEFDEEVTWEVYDFRKPTGCDHKTCPCPGLRRD